MDKCKFCGNETTVRNSQNINRITCPQCGKYKMRLHDSAEELDEAFKPYTNKISSWISEQNIVFNELFVLINNDTIERIIAQPDKKMKEKFECVLKTIAISYRFNHCYLNELDFDLILKKLEEKKLIEKYFSDWQLTYDGIEYLESLEQTNKNSKNIFAAFYFTDELQVIFDTEVKTAIEALNYTYIRVSSSTTDLDTHINDDIIAKLRSAKLVIADFTGQRNSVYFEAGFAMGLNIPIIWTCKDDDVDNLSFDTRQYPHIIWKDADDLADKITKRIQALP